MKNILSLIIISVLFIACNQQEEYVKTNTINATSNTSSTQGSSHTTQNTISQFADSINGVACGTPDCIADAQDEHFILNEIIIND